MAFEIVVYVECCNVWYMLQCLVSLCYVHD